MEGHDGSCWGIITGMEFDEELRLTSVEKPPVASGLGGWDRVLVLVPKPVV